MFSFAEGILNRCLARRRVQRLAPGSGRICRGCFLPQLADDEHRIVFASFPKDAKIDPAKMSRTIGYVNGSIKFVCIIFLFFLFFLEL
jgi:hypothetical protein